MTTTAVPDEPTPQPWKDPIIARGGRYYRTMRVIIMLGLFVMACWFGYDGYVGYPRNNALVADLKSQQEQALRTGDRARANAVGQQLKDMKERTPADIAIQKGLAFGLPPLGILILLWAMYNSRGEYRLEGTTLQVPGHPPVPFENITEIDPAAWDRKGIAYVHYDLGNGRQGKIRLDDFVYDRSPTDEIYRRIETYINPPAEQQQKSAPDPAQPPEAAPNAPIE